MGVMEGKVALVTGAGRGIGREIALSIAGAGGKVVVNDLGSGVHGEAMAEDPAAQVVAEVKALGSDAVANHDSVADPDGAARMVAQALDAFARIDAVVNVAGILRDAMLHKMEQEQWQAVIDVHLTGCFNVSRAAMGHMRAQNSGAFVHFTSTSGLNGNIGQANYAAAKMGIVGLSRVIAQEGARNNIRSNALAPFAWTRMIEQIPIQSEEMAEAFDKMKRNETAAHIAPVVTYLVSAAAAGVSGQLFGVRGNEIYLMSQPRPVRTLHKSDGWTPETLAAMLEPSLRQSFVELDTTGQYYAWDAI